MGAALAQVVNDREHVIVKHYSCVIRKEVVSRSKWIKIFPFVPLWARSDSITDNTTEKINLDEELEKTHWSDCEMFVILRNIQFKNDSHSL